MMLDFKVAGVEQQVYLENSNAFLILLLWRESSRTQTKIESKGWLG